MIEFIKKYFLSCTFINKNNDKNNVEVEKLKCIDHTKIPLFSFKNKVIIARIVDVYDGDTCTLLFEYNGEIMKYKCRAMGYDCAEMKPKKDDPTRDEQKKLAQAARSRFIELIGGIDSIIKVKCLEFDKYGRILGYFYKINDDDIEKAESVNSIMIKEGHGKPYDGGTKEAW